MQAPIWFDRSMGPCETLAMEDDVRQRVIRKFMALPEDKQQKLCDAMGGLLAKLKADWEARPENTGKKVTYTELWDEHAKKMKKDMRK